MTIMTMEKILFLSPVAAEGGLARPALEALAAAVELKERLAGSELHVGLWGREVQAAADAISGCGAASILGVAGEPFEPSRYATDAAAAEALAKRAEATLVVSPTSPRTARALPGVAPRVGGRVETRISAIEVEGSEVRVRRGFYRQRMTATLSRSHRPWLLLLDPGSVQPWQGEAGPASVQVVEVPAPGALTRTRVEGEVAAAAEARTIRPDAEILFVAGAGWTKKQQDGMVHAGEAERLILGFLDQARASLGGSKSLVEQGGEDGDVLSFMTHLNQVGQTGASPRHPKGLATCCHGEEPHVVGWRFIGERRAVNKDPGCGWAHGKADVLYVADAFEVMQEVNRMLQES